MSIEERLISAFNGLVPAASQTYKGDEDEYITINYTAVQVHYFAPHELNTVKTRREITRRIVAAGFTRPSITPASDGTSQHYVYECEDAVAVSEV